MLFWLFVIIEYLQCRAVDGPIPAKFSLQSGFMVRHKYKNCLTRST